MASQLWNSPFKFGIFESNFCHYWGWLSTLLGAPNCYFFMGRLGVKLCVTPLFSLQMHIQPPLFPQ